MYSLECKLTKVGSVVHFWLLKHTRFVSLEVSAMTVNNLINILKKLKHYFTLFWTIKYWWILKMPSFLVELWSTKKSYTVPFKEISLCSFFVKSFDMLPKQKSYQLMLSFALNLQISVLFTYK